MVARQSNHLRHLVDDLLDVARVTQGHDQLRRQAVDLDATVREAVEAVAARARERRVDLVIPPGCGTMSVPGSPLSTRSMIASKVPVMWRQLGPVSAGAMGPPESLSP
jgi:two-component system CheB/CheR fusion protein